MAKTGIASQLKAQHRLRWLVALAMLGVVSLIASCGGLAFTVANAPALAGPFHRHANIHYGDLHRELLDVYQPDDARGAPVVVFWYGGAWTRGNKEEYRFVGAALARAGFVAILPDYRLYPEVKFPGLIEDGAAALKWAHQHAAEYGGDPDKLVVAGHSAGAHMAAMLALDGRYLQRIGGSVSWIHGLIGLSGPYVLTPNSDVLKQIFAAPNTIADWQPIQFVSAASPATLLLHGSADERVVPGHAERLIAALRALGVPAELKIYAGAKHADTVASISLAARGRTPALRDMVEFIQRVTQHPDNGPLPAATHE